MTVFEFVTASISTDLSSYILSKGKVWKNAFITSLQSRTGVEYSVYKKKGCWQIRGEWANIKHAYRILRKVTTAEDWGAHLARTSTRRGHPNHSVENACQTGNRLKDTASDEVRLSAGSTSSINESNTCRTSPGVSVNSEYRNVGGVQITEENEPLSVEAAPESPVRAEECGEPGSVAALVEPVHSPTSSKRSPKRCSVRQDTWRNGGRRASVYNRRKRDHPRKVEKAELVDGGEREHNDEIVSDTNATVKQDTESTGDAIAGEPIFDDTGTETDTEDSDPDDPMVTIDQLVCEGKANLKTRQRGKSYTCKQCGLSCSSEASLVEHQKRQHAEKTLKCPICDKVYGVRRDLRKHIKRHTAQYKCDKCGKTYKEERNFRQHLRTHEDGYVPPQVFCKHCEKCFTTKYVLQKHIEHVHQGVIPEWQCSKCGKRFKQKHSLAEHDLIHTGERPFPCRICSKAFRHKGSCASHELLHSNVRLFTCEVCGKDFKHRNSLRIHAAVHTSVRNFECTVCNKRFTQKQALIRHERIHSGEKPFMCDLCGDRFNDNSILRRHMMGIHKIQLKSGKQHYVLPADHYRKTDTDDGSLSNPEDRALHGQRKEPNTEEQQNRTNTLTGYVQENVPALGTDSIGAIEANLSNHSARGVSAGNGSYTLPSSTNLSSCAETGNAGSAMLAVYKHILAKPHLTDLAPESKSEISPPHTHISPMTSLASVPSLFPAVEKNMPSGNGFSSKLTGELMRHALSQGDPRYPGDANTNRDKELSELTMPPYPKLF